MTDENIDESIDYAILSKIPEEHQSEFFNYIKPSLESETSIFVVEIKNALVLTNRISEQSLLLMLSAIHQDVKRVTENEVPIDFSCFRSLLVEDKKSQISFMDQSVFDNNIDTNNIEDFDEQVKRMSEYISYSNNSIKKYMQDALNAIKKHFSNLNEKNNSLKEVIFNLQHNEERREREKSVISRVRKLTEEDEMTIVLQAKTHENLALKEEIAKLNRKIEFFEEEIKDKEEEIKKKGVSVLELEKKIKTILEEDKEGETPETQSKINQYKTYLDCKDDKIKEVTDNLEKTQRKLIEVNKNNEKLTEEIDTLTDEYNKLVMYYENKNEPQTSEVKKHESGKMDKSIHETLQFNLGALMAEESQVDFKDVSFMEDKGRRVRVERTKRFTSFGGNELTPKKELSENKSNVRNNDKLIVMKLFESPKKNAVENEKISLIEGSFSGNKADTVKVNETVKFDESKDEKEVSVEQNFSVDVETFKLNESTSKKQEDDFLQSRLTHKEKKQIVHEKQLTFGNKDFFTFGEENKPTINPNLLMPPEEALLSSRTKKSDISALPHDNTFFLSEHRLVTDESVIKRKESRSNEKDDSLSEVKIFRSPYQKKKPDAEIQKNVQFLLDQQALVYTANFNQMKQHYHKIIEQLNRRIERNRTFNSTNIKYQKTCGNCDKSPITDDCYRCLVCDNYYLCQTCQRIHNHTSIKLNSVDLTDNKEMVFQLANFMVNSYGDHLFSKIIEERSKRVSGFFSKYFTAQEYFVEIKISKDLAVVPKERLKIKIECENKGTKSLPLNAYFIGKNYRNLKVIPQKIWFNFSPNTKTNLEVEVEAEFDFKGSNFEIVCVATNDVIISQSNAVFIKRLEVENEHDKIIEQINKIANVSPEKTKRMLEDSSWDVREAIDKLIKSDR